MRTNSKIFQGEEYGENTVKKESSLFYSRLNSQVNQEFSFRVLLSELELQDKAFNFDEVTLESDDLFTIVPQPVVIQESVDGVISAASFEMSLDMRHIERIGYTFLDLLSDIGGIQGILVSFFSVLVGLLNNTFFDDYLVSKLYKY